jgi:hypothetical protein
MNLAEDQYHIAIKNRIRKPCDNAQEPTRTSKSTSEIVTTEVKLTRDLPVSYIYFINAYGDPAAKHKEKNLTQELVTGEHNQHGRLTKK